MHLKTAPKNSFYIFRQQGNLLLAAKSFFLFSAKCLFHNFIFVQIRLFSLIMGQI
jgi:hypothetical protein